MEEDEIIMLGDAIKLEPVKAGDHCGVDVGDLEGRDRKLEDGVESPDTLYVAEKEGSSFGLKDVVGV